MKEFARKYASTGNFPKLHTYPAPRTYFSVDQEEMGGGCSCTDHFSYTLSYPDFVDGSKR